MACRYIKLLFLIYITALLPIICKAGTSNNNNEELVNSFNLYLKAVKLDTLLNATDVSFKNTYMQNGRNGKVTVNNVTLLTLKPAPAFANPLKFIANWHALLKKFNDTSLIYRQLFSRFALLAASAPSSLCIQIGDDVSGTYSYLIYYTNTIKINEPFSVVRAGDDDLNYDPGDLNNSQYGGFIDNVKYTTELKKRIITGINALIRYRQGSQANILPAKSYIGNTVSITAVGLKERITDKFCEGVIINFSIVPYLPDPAGKQPSVTKAAITFNFRVVYASDAVSVNNFEQCTNALNCCPLKVGDFGAEITGLIQKITGNGGN